MTITHDELVNLDATIVEFVIPRLRAFRAITQTYPADLPTHDAWLAELDLMIAAFAARADRDSEEFRAAPCDVVSDGFKLFADRLEHLWL